MSARMQDRPGSATVKMQSRE